MSPNPDHEQNRKLWNEIAQVHYDHPDYNVKRFLDGWCSLHPIELREIGDVNNRSLLHLQCQFGLDTLSWARRGASVTGVDISDTSIQLAQQLAELARLKARFVRSDVLELPGRIDELFDIVFQSYGTYIWISDLAAWGRVVAQHLKPGGFFFIVDQHPVWELFGYPEEKLNYFAKEPTRYPGGVDPDYCDTSYVPEEGSVEFMHTMADVVNSLIDAGLTIDRLDEYNYFYYRVKDDWYEKDRYWYPPDGPQPYPMMFSLKARKPA